MAHALGLRHAGRRALKKIIGRLLRRHEIEEVQNGRYALAGKKVEESLSRRVEVKHPEAGASGHGLRQTKRAGGTPAVQQRRDPNVITGRVVTHRGGYG
ncbi:MAG: hypothetical protein M1451_06685, partial [Acidobacteria bacterium]|nr:hypothetical protein [Acidobacteriota bacterium]